MWVDRFIGLLLGIAGSLIASVIFHSNDRIVKHKVGLLNLADELGNVSKACKIMRVSREIFYRKQHNAGLIQKQLMGQTLSEDQLTRKTKKGRPLIYVSHIGQCL